MQRRPTTDIVDNDHRRGPDQVVSAVRRWKSLTVHLPGWVIDEFSAIARELSVSRVALVRDALVTAGLAYARGLLRSKRGESGKVA